MKTKSLIPITLSTAGLLLFTCLPLCAQAKPPGTDKQPAPAVKAPGKVVSNAATNSAALTNRASAKPHVRPPVRVQPKVPAEAAPAKNYQQPNDRRNNATP